MKLRNYIIGAAVAIGGCIVAVKKLMPDEETNKKVADAGKKIIDETKEFGKSISEAAKEVKENIKVEGKKVSDEISGIKDEIKEKIKEKETETETKSEETYEKEDITSEEESCVDISKKDAGEVEVNE